MSSGTKRKLVVRRRKNEVTIKNKRCIQAITNSQKKINLVNEDFIFNSKPIVLDEISKNKITVLSFWATWCVPCINELDAISEIYDEWQDENQQYVDSKSNNRIAYVHMKNMGGGELQKFKEDLVSSTEADKDA